MEYTQWDLYAPVWQNERLSVLILVVMEYTQWDYCWKMVVNLLKVLILVVMEYTQWGYRVSQSMVWECLNPCCNGIYSMRQINCFHLVTFGLNPCCNGIYSMRK